MTPNADTGAPAPIIPETPEENQLMALFQHRILTEGVTPLLSDIMSSGESRRAKGRAIRSVGAILDHMLEPWREEMKKMMELDEEESSDGEGRQS